MGYNIETKLVNGVSGDSALYCFFPRTGDAVLFDLGEVYNLSNREILKVKTVFVSHTHIDHFIGFDHLLRIHIPVACDLNFFGPPGIIENVEGKLRGYHWNLLTPGQIKIRVNEISPDLSLSSTSFINDDGFIPHPTEFKAITGGENTPDKTLAVRIAKLADNAYVDATILDHGCPVVSYAVQSPLLYHVSTHALQQLNLTPGEWIRELQTNIAQGMTEKVITTCGKTWKSRELAETILQKNSYRALGYTTDCIFSQANLERIKGLMEGVDKFFCESCFRSLDSERAFQKKHLTTKQAALIAATIKAHNLITFHYSTLYSDDFSVCAQESRDFLAAFRGKDTNLTDLINAEIDPS